MDALAQHPSVQIRLALASEDDLPREVAELLITDFDATVAHAARWQLDRRPPSSMILKGPAQ